LLRINTGNIEFSSLFAPKPQGMTAADDWTKEMSTKGFPEIKQIYALYGKADEVFLSDHTEFGHNFNAVSRKAMYELVNRVFGLSADVNERDYVRSTTEELSVWNSEHPRPESGDAFERKLLKHWHTDNQSLIAQQLPTDSISHADFQSFMRVSLSSIFGRSFNEERNTENDLEFEQSEKLERDQYYFFSGKINKTTRGEIIPVRLLYPKLWNQEVVIWTSEKGKHMVADSTGDPTDEAKRLLNQGFAVIGADLFMQGDFVEDGQPVTQGSKVEEKRESAAYSFGYNHSLFAQRAHDIISIVAFAKSHDRNPSAVHLVAIDKTGPIAAAARALCGVNVERAVIHTHGFRFGNVTDYLGIDFVPGAAKYGDLDGMLAVAAPGQLLMVGEGQIPPMTAQAYKAVGGSASVRLQKEVDLPQVVDWLSGK
jgi:hypothetical protein